MAQRFIEPIARIFTNAGAVGVGYKYYFYQTGTTTPVTTYQNAALTVTNTNPVLSDANGRFPEIWYSDLSQLKLIVKDSSNNTIETVDPVGATASVVSLNDFDVRPTSYWGLTAGTSTAYTLVANPTISAYANTQTFVVQVHVDCGASPTLAIDGLSALNWKKYTQQGTKVAMKANDLRATQRYFCINDGVDVVCLNPNSLPILSGSATALTIASGVVTLTNNSSSYVLDTEGAAASDDLDTINGGQDGQIIYISCANASRLINLKNNTGNIKIENGGTITLNSTTQIVGLRYNSTVWEVLFNSQENSVLQVVNTTTGAVATGITTMPFDDTIPQISEGDEYITRSITPKSANSKLKIDVVIGCLGCSSDTTITIALFQDSTANAIAAVAVSNIASTRPYPASFSHYMTAGTTSSTTFKVRIGGGSAGTITFNGVAGARIFGGVSSSSITITEYQN